jgi:hypothetical protein
MCPGEVSIAPNRSLLPGDADPISRAARVESVANDPEADLARDCDFSFDEQGYKTTLLVAEIVIAGRSVLARSYRRDEPR